MLEGLLGSVMTLTIDGPRENQNCIAVSTSSSFSPDHARESLK
jgi:hypothetical protein